MMGVCKPCATGRNGIPGSKPRRIRFPTRSWPKSVCAESTSCGRMRKKPSAPFQHRFHPMLVRNPCRRDRAVSAHVPDRIRTLLRGLSETYMICDNFTPQRNLGSHSCVAYCTAETYDFDSLLKALQKERVPAVYFSEVIHITIPRIADPVVSRMPSFASRCMLQCICGLAN